MALWGESVGGVLNKLPTYETLGSQQAQVDDNLGTAAGLVLAKVGDATNVPAALQDLAAKVVEWGAAAMTEAQDHPEQSTSKDSPAAVMMATFTNLLEQLVGGVEAMGGEPNVQQRPAYNFSPPLMIQYQSF